VNVALVTQPSTDGSSAKDGLLGNAQQPTLPVGAAASDLKNTSLEQPSTMNEKDQVQISVGQVDGAAEGAFADGAQHLGVLLDAVLGAGVVDDGESKKDLGSVMKMAIMSNGELTPVRRSKRNAEVADVDSQEKAERRVVVKNLEEPQGNLNVNSFCSFSNVRIKENLGRVGISLGDKDDLMIGSIALLKNVERERLKPSICLNKNENEFDSEEDEID